MNTPALRLKYVLATHYRKVAVTALICTGICVFLLVLSVPTPALAISPHAEEPVPEPTTHRAGVSQEAAVTITNSTDAFTEGQTLEDRSVFPLQNASAPVVTASADAQDAVVDTIEVRIVYTASATGNAQETFYAKEETVATKRIDGTAGTLETVVPVESVFERKTELEAEFGSGVTVTPILKSVVTYQYTSVAGRTQTDTVSVTGEITSVGELYSLPGGSEQAQHTTGPPATDPTSPLLNAVIGTVGGGFILLFGATLFVGYRSDPKQLSRRIQAERYAEWVTEIESYTPRGETNVVRVQTMAGLVNLAIDMHERVLYTAQLDEYIVMDGHTMYKYRPDDCDIDGGSEFFGLNDPGEMPEFDTNGNPITEQSPSGKQLFDRTPAGPETDSDGDADSDP